MWKTQAPDSFPSRPVSGFPGPFTESQRCMRQCASDMQTVSTTLQAGVISPPTEGTLGLSTLSSVHRPQLTSTNLDSGCGQIWGAHPVPLMQALLGVPTV